MDDCGLKFPFRHEWLTAALNPDRNLMWGEEDTKRTLRWARLLALVW